MRLIWFLFVSFINLSLLAEHPKNILFIGNSYLYYNNSVHNYVEFMLDEAYNVSDVETKLSAIGGSRLHHHNIDHLLDFRNLNLNQQVDLIIMQGGSAQVTNQKNREEFISTAVKYSQKAQSKGIKTALYMTHAYTEADERYEPNLIEKITKTYYEAGIKSRSMIIPVGLAFELAYKEKPSIKLHHPDGTHPGPLGTYLASATVVASITNKSPEGLKFNYFDSISDNDRVFLQEIAWKAYLINKKQLNMLE
tara:strand:- start:1109 stop:1861 length:753 start_codon:yes stop_codon:yes gene_type:complete